MSSVVNVVLPVFALILLGYLCRRSGRMGPTGASELNRFVVWLGLPALLFSLTAKADWAHIWQPGFLLAFSGGIGEHDSELRAQVCERLSWLGIRMDEQRNQAANGQGAYAIHAPDSAVEVWVVPTDEGRIAAKEAAALLAGQPVAAQRQAQHPALAQN